MTRYAHITGWGMAVPERVLTQMVDTTDEWIRSHSGIRERHIAGPEQSTATLAIEAALKALEIANLSPTDLDLIIVASASPEHIFPATACMVQDQIGATKAGAFDLLAACTGFIYALNMGAQAIRSGSIDNVLIIGAETLSRFTNWQDRGTCILFADGAGAFVLQGSEQPGGLLSAILRSDGSGGDLLSIPAGGSHLPASEETVRNRQHYIRMNGREVFRFAARAMAQVTREALSAAQLTMDDIQLVVPHQANLRIIENAARELGIPLERCAINIDRYGNTSTASIPIAVYEAVQEGRLKAGDHIVLVGFGAGLTWGAAVAQWSGPFPTKRRVHPARRRVLARIISLMHRLRRFIEGLIWGRENTEK
jgi:3-oxoacyl-[acyl-carrier-protein] synthase-3